MTTKAAPSATLAATDTLGDKLTVFVATDVADAGWRTGANQLAKLTRDPLAALLCRHLDEDSPEMRAKMAQLLKTEFGLVLVTSMLSAGVSGLPFESAITERLAKELRIKALAESGNLLAEIVTGPLRQVLAMYLKDGDGADDLPPQIGSSGVPSFGATETTRTKKI